MTPFSARPRRTLLALALATTPLPVAAQSRSRLEIDLGVLHALHRDAEASPLKYGGAGAALSLAYARRAGSALGRLDLGLSTSSLHSAISSGGTPSQDLARAYVELSADAARSQRRYTVGARLSGDVALRVYHPAGSNASDYAYVFMHAALGPQITRRWSPTGRPLVATLGVPVLGAVVRPYTDVRIIPREGVRWTLATPVNLQSAALRIALMQRPSGRTDWSLVYRAYLARYDGNTPYRAIENTVAVRLGIGAMRSGTP